MTRAEARAELHTLAGRISEPDPAARVERLLERVASRDDAPELRAALAELGALALLADEARA